MHTVINILVIAVTVLLVLRFILHASLKVLQVIYRADETPIEQFTKQRLAEPIKQIQLPQSFERTPRENLDTTIEKLHREHYAYAPCTAHYSMQAIRLARQNTDTREC